MEAAGGLGDRAAHRRVDGERVRELVDGQALRRPRARPGGSARWRAGRRRRRRPRCRCPGGQNSFTKPSRTPCILARGLLASGSVTHSASISPASTASCDQPTVAISGAVKTFDDTVLQVERRDRVAEGVPHRDPALHGGDRGEHQHAGAVAGRVDAAGATCGRPGRPSMKPAVVERARRPPRARGRRCSGTEPTREQAVRALDRAAVGQRDGHPVADRAPPTRHPRLRQHRHAAPGEDVLEHLGGVGVLAGQHPVAAGDQRHVGRRARCRRWRTRRR